ncbi:MAG: hypothetical protein LQ351_001362 [Letrouitia transgressa]|nr:MAG: hypothetical protein LQ351_001362 [Letrouitia transgressa]
MNSLSSDAPLPFSVRFYSQPNTTDHRGRTLATILAWPDDNLEWSHDYIQNLFPLPERSPYNPSAPVIDRATFDAFRSNAELRERLRDSFVRMLRFYGFELHTTSPGELQVVQDSNFREAAQNWVSRSDHNHLRITRIIRSCRVLGLENEAAAFHEALRKVIQETGRIGVLSQKYWARAAKRPLAFPPEEEEDVGRGAKFLYEFDEARKAQGQGEHEASKKGGN